MISSVSDSIRDRIDPVQSSAAQVSSISLKTSDAVLVVSSIMMAKNEASREAGFGRETGILPVSSRK